jgi:hypothetical protein
MVTMLLRQDILVVGTKATHRKVLSVSVGSLEDTPVSCTTQTQRKGGTHETETSHHAFTTREAAKTPDKRDALSCSSGPHLQLATCLPIYVSMNGLHGPGQWWASCSGSTA